MSETTGAITSIVVHDDALEMIEQGSGRPILFLHPGIGIDPGAPVLAALARGGRLLAPSHPGFGNSPLRKGVTTVDDLSYIYLDLLEQLDLRETLVVGVGLGAWIACEIAVKSSERLSHLVLANPIGIKAGDRETRDIVDIWSLMPPELDQLAWANPELAKRDYKTLPETSSVVAARNREALARYAWSPYMHNPKLKARLHRVRIPSLVLFGTADRILSESYARAFAAAIPGSRFETMERAGHYPHLEQPDEFARRTLAFRDEGTATARRA